jgi:hypothetical protein
MRKSTESEKGGAKKPEKGSDKPADKTSAGDKPKKDEPEVSAPIIAGSAWAPGGKAAKDLKAKRDSSKLKQKMIDLSLKEKSDSSKLNREMVGSLS